MNVTRESHVKIMGRWVRVPNWAIVSRPWSTARKNRARDNAARLGALQNFVMRGWVYPAFACIVVIGAMLLVGAIEHGL
jgi:hypothetical protein